ncbi:hypothetical protein DPMN_104669 [Dreissena polymorpha]|uniref:Uncharacterized protein n=1 Tax=Dreissena polymorpha TaxID=45954 RepID=A0A9D4HAW4_DREPO|nr:hypothetical protein DPMN_104669 [Dreissena polymorpha]
MCTFQKGQTSGQCGSYCQATNKTKHVKPYTPKKDSAKLIGELMGGGGICGMG